jgi:hypothetical protein
VGYSRFSPCGRCGCDDQCAIGLETFDGSLTDWTTLSGSPSTSGGALVLHEGEALTFNKVPSSAEHGIRLQLTPQSSDADARLRIIVARTDADHYLFCEWQKASGVGTIRIGMVYAGVESWLTPAITLEDTGGEMDNRPTLSICLERGTEEIAQVEVETGPRYPTVALGIDWSNPEYAIEDDTNYAQWSGTFDPLSITNALGLKGFPFDDVPNGSEILGYTVRVRHADLGDGAGYVKDNTVHLLHPDGGAIGDNKAENTLIGGTDPVARAYGGDADDWGMSLTTNEIKDPAFGVTFTYINDGPDSSTSVIVDEVTMELKYLTPPTTGDVLTFSYHNTADPFRIQCVKAPRLYHFPGLTTGLEAVEGDWNVTGYDLQYHHSEAKSSCLECECQFTCADANIPSFALITLRNLTGDEAIFNGSYLIPLECEPCMLIDSSDTTPNCGTLGGTNCYFGGGRRVFVGGTTSMLETPSSIIDASITRVDSATPGETDILLNVRVLLGRAAPNPGELRGFYLLWKTIDNADLNTESYAPVGEVLPICDIYGDGFDTGEAVFDGL